MAQYKDKQIMNLSNSRNSNPDFIDLLDNHHQISPTTKGETAIPSYEFYPIGSKSGIDSGLFGGEARASNATEFRNYGSLDSFEPAKPIVEKDTSTVDVSLSEIDHTVKRYADNLLRAIESVSARLSQLETRSRQIETSVDELKLSVDNNHGNTDGKLRLVENILREVQDGVQVIKNKQDIMDTQLQFAKFQFPKLEQEVDTHNTTHLDSAQPATLAQPPPTLLPPNAPPVPLQQNLRSQVQPQNHFLQTSIQEAYFPPTGEAPENPGQQYQMPAPQQLPTSIPPPPPQQYQPSHSHLYSQTPPTPQVHPPLSSVNPSQPQPPLSHRPEERHHTAPQTYPQPNSHQPPSHPSSGAPASQKFYAALPNMFETPSSRQGPGFSGSYGPSTGSCESHPYSSSLVQYGSSSPFRSQQLASPAMSQIGGSGYSQLPTARLLPQALPTASAVSSSSSSPRAGNRVPIDDVIDKVTNMGFSRDQVRATVWRLTENGQSVDLNVVLDKLMNDGEGQPPQGWYDR